MLSSCASLAFCLAYVESLACNRVRPKQFFFICIRINRASTRDKPIGGKRKGYSYLYNNKNEMPNKWDLKVLYMQGPK